MGVYHLLVAAKSRQWLYVAVTALLVGVTYLPWLSVTLTGARDYVQMVSAEPPFWEVIANVVFTYSNGFWVGAVLLLALAVWKFPRKNRNWRFIVSLHGDGDDAPNRRLSALSHALYAGLAFLAIFLAHDVAKDARRAWLFWRLAADAGLVSPVGCVVSREQPGADWREWLPYHRIGASLNGEYARFMRGDEDVLVFDTGHYFNIDTNLKYYRQIFGHRFLYFSGDDTDEAARLQDLGGAYPSFWFAVRPVDAQAWQDWLEREAVAAALAGIRLCYVALDELVQLSYWHVQTDSMRIGRVAPGACGSLRQRRAMRGSAVEIGHDDIHLSLWWDMPDYQFDKTYGYSLQVFDGQTKVAQADELIRRAVIETRIPIGDLAPGAYSLRLILYSADDVKSIGGKYADGSVFDRESLNLS